MTRNGKQKSIKPLTGRQFAALKKERGLTGREQVLCATIDRLAGQLKAAQDVVARDKSRVVSYLESEKDKYEALIESLPPDAVTRRRLMTAAHKRFEESEKTDRDWWEYFSARQVAHGKPAVDIEATLKMHAEADPDAPLSCLFIEVPANKEGAQ